MRKTDVVVIGAGAVGCAVARELTKYKVNVLVLTGGCRQWKNSVVRQSASRAGNA